MRPMVARLTSIENPDPDQARILEELGEDMAKPGMLYIIDDTSQAIIWPAFLFLRANYGSAGLVTDHTPVPSFATNRKDAYNLREWLAFLAALKRDWRKADHETLFAYAGYQISQVSQHSGKKRDPNTVGIKMGTVKAFYSYTNAIGLSSVQWDAKSIAARYRRNRRRRPAEDENIRPFSVDEGIKMREALGPLPTELAKNSLRSTRDRLIVETGLRTGMRGEEICYLRASAFKSLVPDPDRPNATQAVRIQVTKGRVHRPVAVPNGLIVQLQSYIKGERARSVKRLARKGIADHGYLFVNFDDASRPGGQLKTNTIHRSFNALMRRLDMIEPAKRSKKGTTVVVALPTHSFHDTRHTFAVRYYVGLKKEIAKNPYALNFAEPWEIVQIALGHADWETTRKNYLQHVGEFEAEISERVHGYLGEW